MINVLSQACRRKTRCSPSNSRLTQNQLSSRQSMKRLEFVNSFATNRSGFGLMVELNHGSLFLSIVRFGLKNLTNANKLGAMARQASAERAWASISRFNENVKKGIKGKKVGFPKFQKNCRSVEYKTNS